MDETPCVEGTVGGDPAAGELPDAGMGADSGVQPIGLDGRCLVCSVEHPCLFDVLVRAFSLQCRGDEVGGSVLIERASNGIHVEL